MAVKELQIPLLRFLLMTQIFCAFTKQTKVDEPQVYGEILPDISRSMSFFQNSHTSEHKCLREVPAIFFQTEKHVPIRGNGSTIFFHRIEVCCEGYVSSGYDQRKCVPDCSRISPDNCHNGFCRAPNECECFEEYVHNDRGECVETCPIACQHGRCYLNGTCFCYAGYALDPKTQKFCRPVCSTACGNNEECVSPGQCACKQGYRWTNEFGCQPICTPDCGFGKCVGPNLCECFDGYIKRPQRKVCEAGCYIPCENGFCESMYKCICRDGYKYDTNTTSCLPDCGDDCQNGICITPGVCKCFEGYESRGNSCEPICYGGCGIYGRCVEPHICACGYANQHCLLGLCDYNGHCLCPTYFTHFIDRCIEPYNLRNLINSYDQRRHYNMRLRNEFEGLIGNLFKFYS